MLTLHEAWDVTVTRAEALAEVRRHGARWAEFLADVGDREEYEGGEVLGWLGY